MKKILVIGASGFLGRHVAQALLADGYAVRCVARNPARVQDLATAGCEVVQGYISDLASMQHALQSVDAAYISVHTLSPQQARTAGQGFMDVEMDGLRNIVTACRTNGVRRLMYVTFLGVAPDSPSAWVRGRWEAQQFLLNNGRGPGPASSHQNPCPAHALRRARTGHRACEQTPKRVDEGPCG